MKRCASISCALMVHFNVLTKIFWSNMMIEEGDEKVSLWVKAELMHRDGDVPELKDWDEIYSIIYPAGVSLWLSVNPWDLLLDLEGHSFHTTSGSVPGGINSSSFFFLMTVRTSMREFWQVGKKHWNRSSSFLLFSSQLLIHKPSLNRPIWHLVASSSTPLNPQLAGRAAKWLRDFFFSFLCACDFALPVHTFEAISLHFLACVFFPPLFCCHSGKIMS